MRILLLLFRRGLFASIGTEEPEEEDPRSDSESDGSELDGGKELGQ